jgi:hypothetical protein
MLGVRVLEVKRMVMTHAVSTERLVNVLQNIALSQQTGRLSIERVGIGSRETGKIFFENGDTVFARTGQRVGESALYEMLAWKEVYTTFAEGVGAPAETGKHSLIVRRSIHTGPLLPIEMEMTRPLPLIKPPAQKQPVQAVEAKIDGDVVFSLRPTVSAQKIVSLFERRERVVVLLLNGKRSLREIARLIHRSEFDVARVLARCLHQGLIENRMDGKNL